MQVPSVACNSTERKGVDSFSLLGAQQFEELWRKVVVFCARSQGCVAPDRLLDIWSSDPCNRGVLKGTFRALVVLEDMSGVKGEDTFTAGPLYGVMYKELALSPALLGQVSRDPPRRMMSRKNALERLSAIPLLFFSSMCLRCGLRLHAREHCGFLIATV